MSPRKPKLYAQYLPIAMELAKISPHYAVEGLLEEKYWELADGIARRMANMAVKVYQEAAAEKREME